MQHDKSPDDLRVGPWIPGPRVESTAQAPPPSHTSSPTVPLPRVEPPASSVYDETVVLPVFVTGKKPERPPAHQAAAETTLPASERGMLVFVAALLGLGTIAVVAMMGFGFAGGSGPKPTRSDGATPSPSPRPSAVAMVPPPAPAPATSPAGRPSAARSTSTARHSATTTAIQLGNLTYADVTGFCQNANNGTAVPPGWTGPTWVCLSRRGRAQQFQPADVCRWKYQRSTAQATIGDIATPSTWHCYA